jgi:hypothetical protein
MTDDRPKWITVGNVPRVMVPTAIFPRLAAGLPAARAYAVLAERADYQTGRVTITESQVAEEAEMSRRQAGEGLRRLIDEKWVTRLVRGQHGRASVYELHTSPTRGFPHIGDAGTEPQHADFRTLGDGQHAESRVLEEPQQEEIRTLNGPQHADYPTVTSGNPHTSSVPPQSDEGGGLRRREAAARPAEPAAAHEPSTDARILIARLPWPPGDRPTAAKATELTVRVDAAVREHGLTLAEVDTHLRGRLPKATKNPVSYLLGALDPHQLPAPTAVSDTNITSSMPATEDPPSTNDDQPTPASPETREAAKKLVLTNLRAARSPRVRAQVDRRLHATVHDGSEEAS